MRLDQGPDPTLCVFLRDERAGMGLRALLQCVNVLIFVLVCWMVVLRAL